MRALAARDDIDAERIGLVGASQAGWVMPMASGTGETAFTITLSGGATAVSLENLFSSLTRESESGADGLSIEAILLRMTEFEPADAGFEREFSEQRCPGLWLYGGLDRSNPSVLCIELLERVREETGNDFTIEYFPRGNHGLTLSRFGGAAERSTLDRFVPGLFGTIDGWLGEQELLAP